MFLKNEEIIKQIREKEQSMTFSGEYTGVKDHSEWVAKHDGTGGSK